MLQQTYHLLDNLPPEYFDPPERDVVGTTVNQLRKTDSGPWRAPLRYASRASTAGGPHDTLLCVSYGHHPEFGYGHTVLTDGTHSVFWDGVNAHVVHVRNVTAVPVVLDGPPPKVRESRTKSQSILDLL